jgi:hypothetical protein
MLDRLCSWNGLAVVLRFDIRQELSRTPSALVYPRIWYGAHGVVGLDEDRSGWAFLSFRPWQDMLTDPHLYPRPFCLIAIKFP